MWPPVTGSSDGPGDQTTWVGASVLAGTATFSKHWCVHDPTAPAPPGWGHVWDENDDDDEDDDEEEDEDEEEGDEDDEEGVDVGDQDEASDDEEKEKEEAYEAHQAASM